MFEGLFQPFHLLVILVIALIVFGPGKLSDVGGSLGKAIKGFKKAMNDDDKRNAPSASRGRTTIQSRPSISLKFRISCMKALLKSPTT